MSKNLVIVESPAKAKTIEKYLGKDFGVLASYGHVRDLIPKEGAVDPDNNFEMKYEIIELIWKIQIILAEEKINNKFDKKEAESTIKEFDNKWEEWTELKKNNPDCPTLYEIHRAVYIHYTAFQESIKKIKNIHGHTIERVIK